MKKLSDCLKTHSLELFAVVLFLSSRLPGLGHDVFNTDVWKWKARSYDFGSGVFGLSFDKTLQKYHPGVTLMWIGAAGIKIYNFYYQIAFNSPPLDNSVKTVFELHAVQKTLIALVLGVTLAFVVYPLNKMFGRLYAFLFVMLLVFEPYYIALTRVMHLEGLTSTFILASFVWAFYSMEFVEQGKSRFAVVLSGIFGGLALLTKTSALFLLPGLFLIYFNNGWQSSKPFKSAFLAALKKFLVWCLPMALTFIFLWPAVWYEPIKVLEVLYRGIFVIGVEREHPQLYFGKWVDDPGSAFYFVVFLFRSSLYVLAGATICIVYIILRALRPSVLAESRFLTDFQRKFAASAGILLFFYLLEITIPSKKLDRYILPFIVLLIPVVAFFYVYVVRFLGAKSKVAAVIVSIALFIPAVATAAVLHPNYLSYYNPLVGGLRNGIHVLEPKWIFGQRELENYISTLVVKGNYKPIVPGVSVDELMGKKDLQNRLIIAFPEKYYTQFWPFVQEAGGFAVIEDLNAQSKWANYFIYPVWDDTSINVSQVRLEYISSIKLRGVNIYNVYKNTTQI